MVLNILLLKLAGYKLECHKLQLSLVFVVCGLKVELRVQNIVQAVLLPFLQQENAILFQKNNVCQIMTILHKMSCKTFDKCSG